MGVVVFLAGNYHALLWSSRGYLGEENKRRRCRKHHSASQMQTEEAEPVCSRSRANVPMKSLGHRCIGTCTTTSGGIFNLSVVAFIRFVYWWIVESRPSEWKSNVAKHSGQRRRGGKGRTTDFAFHQNVASRLEMLFWDTGSACRAYWKLIHSLHGNMVQSCNSLETLFDYSFVLFSLQPIAIVGV